MSADAPPAAAGPALAALWQDAHGDWAKAHALSQEDAGAAGSWVHAYLHRKEGDLANARYWYARAGRTPPEKNVTLDAERDAIIRALL
jgi:hypothetical protein